MKGEKGLGLGTIPVKGVLYVKIMGNYIEVNQTGQDIADLVNNLKSQLKDSKVDKEAEKRVKELESALWGFHSTLICHGNHTKEVWIKSIEELLTGHTI